MKRAPLDSTPGSLWNRLRERYDNFKSFRSLMKTTGKALLLSVAVAEIVAFAWLTTSLRQAIGTEEPPTPDFLYATEETKNNRTLFSFRYPSNWRTVHTGNLSKVRDSMGQVLISMSEIPSRDLLSVTDDVNRLLDTSYRNVVMTSRHVDSIGSDPVVLTKGRVRNSQGDRLAFEIAIIESENRTFAITGFLARESRSKANMQRLHEVIRSFEAPPV